MELVLTDGGGATNGEDGGRGGKEMGAKAKNRGKYPCIPQECVCAVQQNLASYHLRFPS